MVPPPQYIPAPHLITSSRLTPQELVSHFEDFSNTLRYVSSAPELVFERLVANLSDSLNATFESGWQANSSFEASRLAIETLAVELREKSSIIQVSQRANEALATQLGELSRALQASQVNKEVVQQGQRDMEYLAVQLEEISRALQASRVDNEAVQQGQRAIEYLTAQLDEKSLALQSSQVDKEALHASQLANKKLTAELEELKKKIPVQGPSTVAVVKTAMKSNPVIGDFHTRQVRAAKEFPHQNSKKIPFASTYTMVPGIVVGLTAVDASCGANVRAKAYTSAIQRECFTIHIDSWMNTTLYGAGCTWLQIEADDMDFQYGSYHTLEDHDWYQYPAQNTRKVNFKRPYLAIPKVVVWLTVIDVGHGSSWRIKSYATDVTAKGFTIHIDGWLDSRLYSAMASWVAYPADRPGIASGIVSTHSIRSWAQPRASNSAFEAFDVGVFERQPRVFMALNALDIDRNQHMRLHVKVDNVSAAGMTWHLNAWADTTLYSAGASYIALS